MHTIVESILIIIDQIKWPIAWRHIFNDSCKMGQYKFPH